MEEGVHRVFGGGTTQELVCMVVGENLVVIAFVLCVLQELVTRCRNVRYLLLQAVAKLG